MGKTQRNTITLHKHLGVTAAQLRQAGVMNVLLGTDTKLFVDPKLIGKSSVPEFSGADSDIHDYFKDLIAIHKQSEHVERLQRIAIGKIAIKEPQGLSIGYGNRRDSGTSIKISVARQALKSLSEVILVGLEDEKVMELLGLFIKGFGPDSISDLVIHINYLRFCEYTQRVAKELDIKTRSYRISGQVFKLPAHPHKPHQLIFIPRDIVRDLPLATSWEEVIAAAQHNARLRSSFNKIVGSAVKAFVKGIKSNPSLITSSSESMKTLIGVYNQAKIKPYDSNVDPLAHDRILEYEPNLEKNLKPPSKKILTLDEVLDFVNDEVIKQYRRCIENNAGNTLLYRRKGKDAVDPTQPVKEDAAQTLFYLVADILCRLNNVMLNREPNAGQGAVDFSLGKGYHEKILVEIKKSTNKKLLDGYNKQLKDYIENEKAAHGFYVVVVVSEQSNLNKDSQLNQVKRLYAENIRNKKKCPTLVVINGLIRPSPSKR
jgi:hypothetical protein